MKILFPLGDNCWIAKRIAGLAQICHCDNKISGIELKLARDRPAVVLRLRRSKAATNCEVTWRQQYRSGTIGSKILTFESVAMADVDYVSQPYLLPLRHRGAPVGCGLPVPSSQILRNGRVVPWLGGRSSRRWVRHHRCRFRLSRRNGQG